MSYVHTRNESNDGYKFTNKAAEGMYNNAKKTVEDLSDRTRKNRDNVISVVENSFGPGAYATSIVRTETKTSNDNIHEATIKKTAINIDASARVSKKVKEAIDKTTKYFTDPMDPSKYGGVYKYKNRNRPKMAPNKGNESSSTSKSSNSRKRERLEEKREDRESRSEERRSNRKSSSRSWRPERSDR